MDLAEAGSGGAGWLSYLQIVTRWNTTPTPYLSSSFSGCCTLRVTPDLFTRPCHLSSGGVGRPMHFGHESNVCAPDTQVETPLAVVREDVVYGFAGVPFVEDAHGAQMAMEHGAKVKQLAPYREHIIGKIVAVCTHSAYHRLKRHTYVASVSRCGWVCRDLHCP